MNLLFRFNSDGTLKEFTGGNLIQSSVKSDTLYVKVDDVDVSNFVAMAEYKRPDGQVSNDIAMAYGEVPFGLGDGFRQTIPAWCTQLDGQLEITIRLLTFTSDGDKRVFAMTKNVVKVLASTSAGDGEVNITDEQYDALLETLANKSLNEVVGKDVEEYLNQKFEEKSGLIDEYLEEQTSRIENEIDTELKEMDDTIKGLGDLKPSGTAPSSSIISFKDNVGIYIGEDDGNWYYWKASEQRYVVGGVYQATEIADGSITPEKLSNEVHDALYYNDEYIDSRETFEVLSGNYVNGENGDLTSDDNSKYLDYIELSTNEIYEVFGSYAFATCVIATYDKDKNFLRSYGYGADSPTNYNVKFIPKSDEKYARFSSYNWGNNVLSIKKYLKKNIKDEIEKINNDIKINDYYKKDISKEVVLIGNFISKNDGNLTSTNDGRYTDYIETNINETFYVTGKSQYATCLIASYNENKQFLRSYGVNTENDSIGLKSTELEFTPQEDEKYVRFCSIYEDLIVQKLVQYTINEKFEKLNEYNGNVLYGKKYVACGDSFTEGDFTGFTDENGLSGMNSPYLYDSGLRMFKTYPYWIAKRNNMTLINEAKCGSVFTNINAESNPFSVSRYLAVPTDADYITLMFGLNEFNLTTEQIGTKTDNTNATLWGAYNIVFEYFLTNMPYAKIGVIIPDAWMNSTYSNAVKEICSYWGIPYLDLKDGINVPMGIDGRLKETSTKARELRDAAFKVSSENSHPNIEAHKYRSTFIENFLRSL